MTQGILIVDDQRDILRLLHSTLDTLKNTDLSIFESRSGEEAFLEASRNKIDLLITDYLLPGITGVELMHKIRARHPDVKVILITGMADLKARDEMLNAGAMAIFDKPIPLADFLDVVERGLGLVRTIFPPEAAIDENLLKRHSRISDLLANFRQDIQAQAVFLLNDKGMVQARAGDLHDSSMEVSLLSALMAIHGAGLKVSRYIHQDMLDAYYVFSGGGDHDLLFLPVNPMYAMLVAGNGLAKEERILETVAALLAVRNEVENALKSMGVTGELTVPIRKDAKLAPVPVRKKGKTHELPSEPSSPEMEALLKEAAKKKVKSNEMDAFWDQAAEKHSTTPTNPEALTYDQARQLGLAPEDEEK